MSRNTHRAPRTATAGLITALAVTAGLVTWQTSLSGAGAAPPERADGRTQAAAAGATVPYTTYEAEDAATNATAVGPDRTYLTLPSEASGRRAVTLEDTGDYVEFTLTEPANALNLRYSLPDSADGAGLDDTLSLYADGEELDDLDLTSRYSWVYGGYPYTNNPAEGSGHRFFDDTRAHLGRELPAGTVLRLQKDSGDSAASYTVDLLEAEQAPAAADMPDGYVSATGLGVTPDDGQDDTAALNSALATAKDQGSGLWLPAGTYRISDHVDLTGVDLRGTGQWHTVLRGTGLKGGLFGRGGTSSVQDLMIDGENTVRDDAGGHAAIEGDFGAGSLIKNVWIQHTKVGLWINAPTTGLRAEDLRIRNTFADGVNLHGAVSDTVVSNSSIRGTGDDGLAMWSEGAPVTDSSFRNNTVQLPMLANGAAVYGGSGNSIEGNDISDTVTSSAGIAVSTRFGQPFSGPTAVTGNTLRRAGGYEPNWQSELGALWVYADTSDITTPVRIEGNQILDSTYAGLLVSWQRTVGDLTVTDTRVEGAGTYGIEIFAAGAGNFSGVTVTDAASGGLSLDGGFQITRGSGNSGW